MALEPISPQLWQYDHGAKAYGGKENSLMEVYCGEKSLPVYGDDEWLPKKLRRFERVFSGHGALTTPIGGGIRSLNVALSQKLDLFLCQRPIRYFEGVQPVLNQNLLI